MSKLTMPQGRKEWAKTVLVALLLFIVVSVFIGAPYAGWWPVYGRSAWPTIKWWIVPPYLSGYYHVDYSDKDPEPGDIVWFWVPGHWPQTEVKRVERIEIQAGEPCMWLTADNVGWTGEVSSDQPDARYGWVPTRLIVGTVDNIWTPTRWARSKTIEGRVRNLVELKYSPSNIFNGPRRLIALQSLTTFTIITDSGDRKFHSPGYICCWENSRLLFWRDDRHEKLAVWNSLTENEDVPSVDEIHFHQQNVVGWKRDGVYVVLATVPATKTFLRPGPDSGFEIRLLGRWDNLYKIVGDNSVFVRWDGRIAEGQIVNPADCEIGRCALLIATSTSIPQGVDLEIMVKVKESGAP